MKLSIVTSLYRSEPYLEEFCRRSTAAARALAGDDFELILVNDGSPDRALPRALELRAAEPRIKILDLSRNFGHHKALLAGLRLARGERVFLIDADLEEPPELLTTFAAALDSNPDSDVAYGVQRHRKGGWFERLSGRLFYRLMAFGSCVPYPADTLTARLLSRRYVEALKEFDEREFDLWLIFALAGFKQLPIPCDKGDKGSSSYTLGKKLAHAVESLTAASAAPLYFIFFLGLIVMLAAAGHLVFLILNKILWEVPIGWSALAASIWGLGGMIMMSVGILGIYLARIFIETKKRPSTITRRFYP